MINCALATLQLKFLLLDKFFFIFHSCVILFNLFGWIWRKTRLANLVLLSCTAFSWFILGIWYGIGYCPCTDWHWQVRRNLGINEMPRSYIKFLIDSVTGLDLNAALVDIFTGSFFAIAFLCSIFTNLRDWRTLKKSE